MSDDRTKIHVPPKGTRGARMMDVFMRLGRPFMSRVVRRYQKASGPEPEMFMGFPVGVLTTVGAALYFGYWFTRLVGTERQVLESLGRIEQRLGGAPVEEPAAPSTNGTSFVATKTGSMFHRAECPVVAGRPDSELRKVQLPAEGMAPCKLCSPLEAPA